MCYGVAVMQQVGKKETGQAGLPAIALQISDLRPGLKWKMEQIVIKKEPDKMSFISFSTFYFSKIQYMYYGNVHTL